MIRRTGRISSGPAPAARPRTSAHAPAHRMPYPPPLRRTTMTVLLRRRAALLAAYLWGLSLMTGPASAASSTPSTPGTATPPAAEKRPHTFTLHGDAITDDFAWLRDKKDPHVIAYLEAENAYADALTNDQEPLRKKLYDEMLARIQQTDLTVPYRKGGYLYYTRTEEGKQYPIHCRKKGDENGPEQVMLDLNE